MTENPVDIKDQRDRMRRLLDDAIPFIAISIPGNSNPGGKLKAANLIMRIQRELGEREMDVLVNEREQLMEDAGYNII